MSSKLNAKMQIKRSSVKRSQDKFDKAMDDIKKIGIFSCCLVGVMLVVSLFIDPKETYAAGFLQQVPDTFKSGMTTTTQTLIQDENNTISLPTEFYGQTDTGERLSFIYCMDRRLGMLGNKYYTKGSSVKTSTALEGAPDSRTADYPGLIYILQNDNLGGTSAENYYLTQLAVWWYIDRANGFSDEYNYTSYDLSATTPKETNSSDKYDEYGNYIFYNNLSALDKQTIKNNVKYGQKVVNLVEGAIANEGNYPLKGTNREVSIDEASIKYTMTNDYVETSVIKPVSSNSSFESYSIQINDSVENVKIVDENNNPITSTVSASQGFKLRVPISELQGNTFKASVTVVGYFADWFDAYVYNPETNPVPLQRALLGLIEKPSTPTTVNLEAPTIDVPNTSSNAVLVYSIGSLIIVAGIVLIVVALKPKNARKK